MKITTEAEAERAVLAVAEWLKGYTEPARSDDYPLPGETHNAKLARNYSRQILEASTARDAVLMLAARWFEKLESYETNRRGDWTRAARCRFANLTCSVRAH